MFKSWLTLVMRHRVASHRIRLMPCLDPNRSSCFICQRELTHDNFDTGKCSLRHSHQDILTTCVKLLKTLAGA